VQSDPQNYRVLNILREKGYIKAEDARKRAWRYCGKPPGKGISLLGNIAADDPMEAIELSKTKNRHLTGSVRQGKLFCIAGARGFHDQRAYCRRRHCRDPLFHGHITILEAKNCITANLVFLQFKFQITKPVPEHNVVSLVPY
jgi:hypothetical protein